MKPSNPNTIKLTGIIMNKSELIEIIENITYKEGWSLNLVFRGPKPYVQVVCSVGTCSVTKSKETWKGRKQYLSIFMCKQEIVGICFSLFKDAEMHELHEWFRYKGASIYNPHLDPDALVEVARKKSSFITRPDSMNVT